MYRIQPTEAIHVPGYHLVRKALVHTAGEPLYRTLEVVLSNLSAGHPQFVAIVANEVVGWCNIVPGDDASGGQMTGGVAAGFRGRGIGSALVVAALAQAESKGMVKVQLEIPADDVQAYRFLARFGFAGTSPAGDECTMSLVRPAN
ncbi:MAG: GNAT family N-acetyltransferase [Burkholderiales bacterium]|nr:GNAT family N-acetyltransferase [Burkholderiales bacterium]